MTLKLGVSLGQRTARCQLPPKWTVDLGFGSLTFLSDPNCEGVRHFILYSQWIWKAVLVLAHVVSFSCALEPSLAIRTSRKHLLYLTSLYIFLFHDAMASVDLQMASSTPWKGQKIGHYGMQIFAIRNTWLNHHSLLRFVRWDKACSRRASNTRLLT